MGMHVSDLEHLFDLRRLGRAVSQNNKPPGCCLRRRAKVSGLRLRHEAAWS